ncbi:MAG TPA: zinc ribbon domain-containing protein [Pyrinomonadaceae bacterium]|jgi:hypothetical protein
MYCSTCGKSVNENLNYCNNCGARIEKGALQIDNPSSRILFISAGFVGTAGLFGFVVVLKILLESHLDPSAMGIILIAYLATLLLLCRLLVGNVRKHSGDIKIKTSERAEDAPKQFRAGNTAQLEEPKQQPISVTEHTTRTLDKVDF